MGDTGGAGSGPGGDAGTGPGRIAALLGASVRPLTWYHGCGYIAYGAVIPRCPQCFLSGTWANFPHRQGAPTDLTSAPPSPEAGTDRPTTPSPP